jgi:hypothetical protein
MWFTCSSSFNLRSLPLVALAVRQDCLLHFEGDRLAITAF